MALVDRRVDALADLDARIQKANGAGTFRTRLRLLEERRKLADGLHAEVAQVNRLTEGWVYLPPTASKL
jgi:hypothetical protein